MKQWKQIKKNFKKMERYKYQLEKYHGRQSRYTCPQCEKPHSFVRYVDEQGRYIAENVGRCNREDKCGYHLTPSEYFRSKGIDYQPVVKEAPKPLPPTDYIPEQTMVRTLKTDNFLIRFLSKYFQPLELAYAIDKYRIGDAKDGRTIYWQIDEDNRVRTGKIMLYDPLTGHRVKNRPNSFDWAHRYVKKPFQLEQCLYRITSYQRGKTDCYCRKRKKRRYCEFNDPELHMDGNGRKRKFQAYGGR
jgi:hypothetical protein